MFLFNLKNDVQFRKIDFPEMPSNQLRRFMLRFDLEKGIKIDTIIL